MSGKSIFTLVTLVSLSSAAVALTVAQREFGSFASTPRYPTTADFNRTFAVFVDTSLFDFEGTATNREKLRAMVLKRINSTQFGEE